MNEEISVADFLEEDRDEVEFENGEFIYPEKDVKKESSVYETPYESTISDFEKGLAKAYASTVTGAFGVAQGSLKAVYKGLTFLATR